MLDQLAGKMFCLQVNLIGQTLPHLAHQNTAVMRDTKVCQLCSVRDTEILKYRFGKLYDKSTFYISRWAMVNCYL